MKKFEVGQRVVLVASSNLDSWNEYEDDTTRGSVLSLDADGKIAVQWDSSWHKPNPSTHRADELVTEAEADKILLKLEEEFESWAAPIREKMEQAAKCLTEAGELADKQKRDLSEMHEFTSPLISAMRGIGWRTSSLSC